MKNVIYGPENNRMRPLRRVAPMVWEVIGTFVKTPEGTRSIGRQRQYLVQLPQAPKPKEWPKLDDARLGLKWKGRSCHFTPRQRNQHVLIGLLANARGRWVDYAIIAEECLHDEFARADAIRQLKRRLVRSLQKMGLSDLAAVIVVTGEAMQLKL